jgi:hypothetical protein
MYFGQSYDRFKIRVVFFIVFSVCFIVVDFILEIEKYNGTFINW